MSTTRSKPGLSVIGFILSIVLGIVGLLAAIGGFSHVASESTYASAPGVITDLDLQENVGSKPRTKNRCAPIVEFQVSDQTYTSGPDQYSVYGKGSECKYSIGDGITVNYDPIDPTKSTVSDSTFDWLLGIFGGLVAVFFGLLLPIRMIRRSRAEARGSLWD